MRTAIFLSILVFFIPLAQFFQKTISASGLLMQPGNYGWFSIDLPLGWIFDEKASTNDFYTFFHLSNGKQDYVIQLKKNPVPCATQKDFNRAMASIFYDMYARQDYVDKFKGNSEYSAMGDASCHFVTFILKATGERGFIISPYVDGKMFNIYIYDKIGQKKEFRSEAKSFLNELKLNRPPSGELTANAGSGASTVSISPQPGKENKSISENNPQNTLAVKVPSTQAAKPGTEAGSPETKPKEPAAASTSTKQTDAPSGITRQPQNKPDPGAANKKMEPPKEIRPPALLDMGLISFESQIDLATMTSAQYTGAVSMAMEGMRLIYGEMTKEEEHLFEKDWLPMFEYPCKETSLYLNQLNPLISKFLSIREALGAEIEAYNAAAMVVTFAAGEDDFDQVAETMSELEITVATLNVLQKQMLEVVEQILKLGNPPDAGELAKSRRKIHKQALNLLAENTYPFEGEWQSESGDRILIRVAHEYEDGKLLVYAFPINYLLEKIKKTDFKLSKDVDLSAFTNWGALYTWDCLRVFDPLNGATYASYEYVFSQNTKLYSLKKDKLVISTFGRPNPLNLNMAFGKAEYQKVEETFAQPPVNPSDEGIETWEDLLKQIKGDHFSEPKIDQYEKWLSEYRDDLNIALRGSATDEERYRIYMPMYNEKVQPINEKYDAIFTSISSSSETVETKNNRISFYESEKNGFINDIKYNFRIAGFDVDKVMNAQANKTPSGTRELGGQQKSANQDVEKQEEKGGEISEEFIDYLVALKEWETAKAIKEQQEEQVKFHENNIKYFDRNIQSLQNTLNQGGATMKDTTRNRLTRDLLYQQDAMQREQDAIQSIKTGEYVHTRTDLDALNMQMMLARSHEMAEKAHRVKRTLERMPKLMEMADPEELPRLREFFEKNIRNETGEIDIDRLNQAAKSIGKQVTGELEQKAARSEEWAATVGGITEGIEYIKTGADVSMMLISIFAPVYFAHTAPNAVAAGMRAANAARIFMGYQAASGFIEGGVTGAFTRVGGTYNTVTMLANAAMNGYQQGVLTHLEEHSRDAGNVTLSENSAGMWGMGYEVGKEALKTVVFKAALGALMPPNPKGNPVKWSDVVDSKGNPVNASQQKWPTIQQQINAAQFVSRQADGRAKVRLFQQRVQKLSEAGKANAPKEEIVKLRESVEESYKVIKTDYFAKSQINALARQGDTKTTHHYNSCERKYIALLKADVEQEIVAAGFNKQKCQTYSNSSSTGKAGSDLDMGVVEPARYIFNASGKKITNPEHITWRKSITQKLPDGTVVRRSPEDLQALGYASLKKSFEKIYGRPPGEAMVEFTTSYHPEAYRDLAWLGRKGSKTAMVFETDRAWVKQAADVSAFKVNTLPAKHPELGYYGILQEQMRGLTKDFNTKIEPMLKLNAKSNPQATKHLYDIRNTMDAFAKNDIGPIEAERKINELTGGFGIKEVAEQLGIAMQGLRNAIGK